MNQDLVNSGRKGGRTRAKATGAKSLKNIGRLGGLARAKAHTAKERSEFALLSWKTRRKNAK